MQFDLRQATLDDLDALTTMNQQLIIDEQSNNTMSYEQLRERMRDWLDDGWQAVIVERNDEVIGYLVYYEEKQKYHPHTQAIYVRQYFISPSYRRRGIGQVAFEAIAEKHFPQDAAIMLDVLESNPEGKAFWMKLGFEMYCVTLRRD